MPGIQLSNNIKGIQIGKLGSDGLPLDPSIPGNAYVAPGSLISAATHNLNTNETTIEGNCSDDFVETDTSMDIDFTFCEVIRAEILSFINGTPSVLPTPGVAAVPDIDPTTPVGFVMPPLGSNGGGCCPTAGASAAGFYMLIWRCISKCDNTGFTDENGMEMCGLEIIPKLTRFDLTGVPLDWDQTATTKPTYTVKARVSNGLLSSFPNLFPGYTDGSDPLTPAGMFMTDNKGPFPDECGCDLLSITDDEVRAIPLAA